MENSRPLEDSPHRVPTIVHFEALRQADRDLAEERDKRYAAERSADALAVDAALTAAKEAVAVAKLASDEHLKAHNDVLEGWKNERSTFATKTEAGRIETWQTRLTGGMVVIAIIGVSNLVKIWGH
jgi:hypothetical protein